MALRLEDVRADVGGFEMGPITTTFDSGVTVVLGPSGSGKSTLLSLIAGFESPAAGRITLDGRRIDDRPPEERGVGMVFQHFALFPHLSVEENLAFGAAPDRDVRGAAEILEIESLLDRNPGTLSGGEKQRVALARALVSDPSVLLLDEPLASLDAPIRERLRLELRDVLAAVDIPVVYVTHDRDEAAVLGDRLVLLRDGQIVQEGALDEVFSAPENAYVADFLGMENVLDGRIVDADGARTRVVVADSVWSVEGTSIAPGPEDESARARCVSLAIHPDTIQITDHEHQENRATQKPDDNRIEATVRQVISKHRDATVILEGDGVGRLTATMSTEGAADLESGQRVLARVPPGAIQLTRTER